MPAVPVPMTLTQQVADIYAQLKRLRTATSAGGGFDPNADPVVIGKTSSATGADGDGEISIGNSASVNGLSGVAIGHSASVSADNTVAIGKFAAADGDNAVAVGENTEASAISSVAVGDGALADLDYGVAVGYNAWGRNNATAIGASANARGLLSSALGVGAHTTHDYSTAIGQNSACTKDHQIMLGTSAEFVEIPGSGLVLKDTATGTRYLVQITSGALVLNTAP